MAERDPSQTSSRMEEAMADVPVEREGLLVVALNHALEAEANFLALYDVAIRKASGEEVRTKLTEFRRDHEEHVLQLRGVLDQMGLPLLAAERPTALAEGLAGVLEEATSDDALLLDFLASEDFSRRLYQWMTTFEAPEPVARIAQRGLDDEERHYKWAATRAGIDAAPIG